MKYTTKHSGKKNRGALAGYAFAALVAIQPFINDEVDFNKKPDLVRFIFKIGLAMMIAVLSRFLAMNKGQVTEAKSQGH